jgi:hypothetical protein
MPGHSSTGPSGLPVATGAAAIGNEGGRGGLATTGYRSHLSGMNLDLTDHEAAMLLKALDGIIDEDRYFLSDRIKTLKAIRAKIRPEPVREPLPPPPKQYAPPRASAAKRRGRGAEISRG